MALSTIQNNSFADTAVHGRRNLIINGAMQVAQRGNSTGITSSGYYGPDRYTLQLSNLGTWSISQSTTAPSGFGNSYKLEATTADASPAAGDYAIVIHRIEGQNLQQLKKGTSSAESVTLSFWVRSSKTGTYIIELFDQDNNRSISASYTISSANTFEYKTLTFAGDTTGALNNDNGTSLEVIWYLAAGSTYTSGTLQTSWGARTAANQAVGQVNMADTANATFHITGVQLELGSQATPFEHRSYGEELSLCQRYYEKSFSVGTAPANNTGEYNIKYTHLVSGYGTFTPVQLAVTKRANPTVTLYNPTSTTANRAVNTATGDAFTNSFTSSASPNIIIFHIYGGTPDGTGNPVGFNWTAESEL